jgi:hypothetical protein
MGLIRGKTKTDNSRSAARGGSSKFKYQPRTAESVRERATRNVGSREGLFVTDVPFFTPKKGENTVRILPPPPDKAGEWGHYGVGVFGHYDIGADNSAFPCLAKMKGEDCPLCAARDEASKNGEDELADGLKPRERVAIFVIDRSQESKGPLLWAPSAGMDKDIVKLCVDPKTGEALAVDDPADGYDLTFEREGEGLKTKYKGIQFARRSSPLSDDDALAEEWLAYVTEHPLDELIAYKDPEYMAKMFEGQGPPKSRDEGERPTRSKLRGKDDGKEKEKEKDDDAPPRRAVLKPRATKKADDDLLDLPTWEQLEELDDAELADLGEEKGLQFPDEGFEDIDGLRAFVAQELGIEMPEPEPPAKKDRDREAPKPASGGWRDKLQAKLKK